MSSSQAQAQHDQQPEEEYRRRQEDEHQRQQEGYNRYPVQSFNEGQHSLEDVGQLALRSTEPVQMDEVMDGFPDRLRTRVLRQVEVPFTREVQTPVMRKELVPSVIEKRVPITRQVVRQGWEWVEEEYTEIVEELAVREREVWVKKIVEEEYMKKVPRTRTRRVRKPKEFVEDVEDFAVVRVSHFPLLNNMILDLSFVSLQ